MEHHRGGGGGRGGHHGPPGGPDDGEGFGPFAKRRRVVGARRTVDLSSTIAVQLQNRVFWPEGGGPGGRDLFAVQPHSTYVRRMMPPASMGDSPAVGVCTTWVKTSRNKLRCPVNALVWTPEGVTRCITGNSSGEFTLWKDGAFNFETILQAHETAVRCMAWRRGGGYMISGDQSGTIKYWETSMTFV
ncbi:unnamed protein product, partial [Phaeothamnion confervicola]